MPGFLPTTSCEDPKTCSAPCTRPLQIPYCISIGRLQWASHDTGCSEGRRHPTEVTEPQTLASTSPERRTRNKHDMLKNRLPIVQKSVFVMNFFSDASKSQKRGGEIFGCVSWLGCLIAFGVLCRGASMWCALCLQLFTRTGLQQHLVNIGVTSCKYCMSCFELPHVVDNIHVLSGHFTRYCASCNPLVCLSCRTLV